MRVSILAGLLMVISCVAGALAGPVTVNLTGTVDTGNGIGSISAGDAVSASFTYDPSLAAYPHSTLFNGYYAKSTLNGITFGSGAGASGYAEVAGGLGSQYVYTDSTKDRYRSQWINPTGPVQSLASATTLSIELTNAPSVMSTAKLLPTASQLSQFTSQFGFLDFYNAGTSQPTRVNFTFTSLKVIDGNPIPLPSGAAMAVVGMGVIGVRRRRSPISRDS